MGMLSDQIKARLCNLKERDAKLQAEVQQLREAMWVAFDQLDTVAARIAEEADR